MSNKEGVPKTILGFGLKLNVRDRLLMNALFPEKGNLADQLTAKDIAEKVGLETKEREKINFRANEAGDGVMWNAEGNKGINFSFSRTEIKFLKAQVQRLDKASDIGQEIVGMCSKINDVTIEAD